MSSLCWWQGGLRVRLDLVGGVPPGAGWLHLRQMPPRGVLQIRSFFVSYDGGNLGNEFAWLWWGGVGSDIGPGLGHGVAGVDGVETSRSWTSRKWEELECPNTIMREFGRGKAPLRQRPPRRVANPFFQSSSMFFVRQCARQCARCDRIPSGLKIIRFGTILDQIGPWPPGVLEIARFGAISDQIGPWPPGVLEMVRFGPISDQIGPWPPGVPGRPGCWK